MVRLSSGGAGAGAELFDLLVRTADAAHDLRGGLLEREDPLELIRDLKRRLDPARIDEVRRTGDSNEHLPGAPANCPEAPAGRILRRIPRGI